MLTIERINQAVEYFKDTLYDKDEEHHYLTLGYKTDQTTDMVVATLTHLSLEEIQGLTVDEGILHIPAGPEVLQADGRGIIDLVACSTVRYMSLGSYAYTSLAAAVFKGDGSILDIPIPIRMATMGLEHMLVGIAEYSDPRIPEWRLPKN